MADERRRALAANAAADSRRAHHPAGPTGPPGDDPRADDPRAEATIAAGGSVTGTPADVTLPPGASRAPRGAAAAPEESIGPYRLLRKLAEGGMGEVWLAEQREPIRRRLAVKVIKHGMDTAEFVARFASERQALALMDHPCIAKVIDAGTTPRGRPYFAMEYVDGEPILAHCDQRRLGIGARLELFLKVCQGVQHAHQKAIIHRDLKPSNVLVSVRDGEALPKIIDFGVAKALGQELTGHTMQTHLGQLIGTLDYMSPEQADLGDHHVDTGTDVYALGVLLYELLAGKRPLESSTMVGVGLVEILRRIREEEPQRPSQRLLSLDPDTAARVADERDLDPSSLLRRVRGDLDWIVLRAVAKDRTRRYATVHELAADIERHLRDEPVLAGPPTRRYRATKFVRRHRTPVAAAAVALVLVLAGIAGTSVGLVRARQAEQLARQEAETSRQVSGFLESLFEVSDPDRARGETITAREILASGAARIDDQLRDQPATRARLLNTMGRVYHKLGLYDEATPQLEQALDLREGLRERGGPVRPGDVAGNQVDLAELYIVQARYGEAAALLSEALATLDASSPGERLQIADALHQLGGVLRRQGRYDDAVPLYEQSLAIRRDALGPRDPLVAGSYNGLAITAYFRGDWPGAESLFGAALSIREESLGDDHPDVAQTLNNLALLRQAQDDFAGAIPLYTRAAAIWEKTLGPDHVRLALVLNNLGLAHFEQGQLADARPLFERALRIREAALGPDNPDVAQTLQNLADLHRAGGALAEAEALLDRALAVREASLGPAHADVGWTITGLAAVHAAAGDPERAAQEMSRALDILESALGPDFPELDEEWSQHAEYLDGAGRRSEAAAARARAAAIAERSTAAAAADGPGS